ncbi:MAG: DUF3810 domain-containing protein [Bacillota bacterium]|nr:DUF3810 domain-containing protein [Bacillota bacterium]
MKKSKRQRFQIILIVLVPIFILLNSILRNYPGFVEKYYSTGIDKPIRQFLSFITGIFPFSVAEFLFFILVMVLLVMIILMFVRIRKGEFFRRLLAVGAYVSALYIIFMLVWGFNYDRLSFDKIAGLKMEKSSEKELYNLCSNLIDRANTLRKSVKENEQRVMYIPGGYQDVFKRVQLGYDSASKLYPELGGKYGRPKPVLLSEQMCYTGITGIYMPYTGEPNVNIKIRDYMLPCTAAHEMAHQRGFAREDEANYIAYVTCTAHPDPDFQYSGVMLAVIHSMNALADVNIDDCRELVKKYSEGVRADLKDDNAFWARYEGQIEKISDNVNNAYLKSNGQKDGVQSYGRMVDLLLADYRNKTVK